MTDSRPYRLILAGVLFSGLAALTSIAADKEPGSNPFRKAIKSVTWVFSPEGNNRARTGTGSLIDVADKIVITNYHVVGDKDEVFVMFPQFEKDAPITDRSKYEALYRSGGAPKGKVIARESKRDLAIIRLDRIPAGTPALRLAREGVAQGDSIHCIGNPGVSGGLWSYTPGNVRNIVPPRRINTSSKGKSGDGFELNCWLMESNAAVNQGDSGGPVLNNAGEIVGITQGHLSEEVARSLSIAIELREVKDFLRSHKLGRLLNVPPPTSTAAASDVNKGDAPKAEPDAKAEAAKLESTAAFKLQTAKELMSVGKNDKAREKLEDIVTNFGQTKSAGEAKKLLEQLKK